jgi:crotonobetainyl-CoA:carnitine CoA-transferase CaiB-like acyl-CoA transferase
VARPLSGIRVLELGNLLAGPFCGMLLGDMGADVIKIEPRRSGDMIRSTQPHIAGESANYIAINRNKRSIAIDLKQPEGREIVLNLAKASDLVLENFRPGVMESLGLGIEHIRKVNPEIVYVSVSGFGQTGPLRDRSAVNLIIEAASGSLSVTGEPDDVPMRPGVQTGDMFGAMFATYAALAGLMGKVRHGEGRQIDVSLVEASVAAAVWETSEYLATGNVPQRLGHKHRLTAPYQVFQASDGLLVIGCPNDQLFQKIMNVLGLHEAAKDARFGGYVLRKTNEQALLDVIEPAIAKRRVDDLVEALSALGVPCSKVNSYKDVFENEQSKARGIEINGVHRRAGPVKMVRNAVLFDKDGPELDRMAPLLGEQTEEILAECGYVADAIRRLIDAKVVDVVAEA